MIDKYNLEFIQSCSSCWLNQFDCNILNVNDPKNGKLMTNYNSTDSNVKVLFVGIAPSYRRFDSERRALTPAKQGERSTGALFFKAIDESRIGHYYSLFFTNMLRCSIPENGIPGEEEVIRCLKHLRREIEIIKPIAVCSMSRVTDEFVRKGLGKMMKIKGIIHRYVRHPTYYYRRNDINGMTLELVSLKSEIEERMKNARKTLCDF